MNKGNNPRASIKHYLEDKKISEHERQKREQEVASIIEDWWQLHDPQYNEYAGNLIRFEFTKYGCKTTKDLIRNVLPPYILKVIKLRLDRPKRRAKQEKIIQGLKKREAFLKTPEGKKQLQKEFKMIFFKGSMRLVQGYINEVNMKKEEVTQTINEKHYSDWKEGQRKKFVKRYIDQHFGHYPKWLDQSYWTIVKNLIKISHEIVLSWKTLEERKDPNLNNKSLYPLETKRPYSKEQLTGIIQEIHELQRYSLFESEPNESWRDFCSSNRLAIIKAKRYHDTPTPSSIKWHDEQEHKKWLRNKLKEKGHYQ